MSSQCRDTDEHYEFRIGMNIRFSRRRRFFKLATFPTEVNFGPVRVLSVVRFARAVWCNIRGMWHRSRAFSFKEVQRKGALGLGYEGIGCQGPASWSDRPRPVVTDKQKETQSRLRSQNPKLGLACPGCLYGVPGHS